MSKKNQRIQVFARCRPLNSSERKDSFSVVEVKPNDKIFVKNRNKDFAFDKVFPPDSKQIDVYKSVAEPLIQEVLKGYNCTVFAYGQTGTGKTYTMEGERYNQRCSWEDDPGAGIIPRSLHQLFEELNKGDGESVEYSVRVSFLELYNEELFDLLSSTEELSKLRLFEDSSRKGSVVVQGQEEIIVKSKDQVYAILEKGSARRQTAATLLNANSSRSHTIFSVTVHSKENTTEGEELFKIGKLNLVDLAGSECVGRSGCVDKRFREAGNINMSLLTLGRVITALIEQQPHIPYRESKLTRLLQDSLGGHTKTSIIATISPALCNLEETLSTLDYASKAKSITIKPIANQRMTKKTHIKVLVEKIERLQKDLDAARSEKGFFIDKENYEQMTLENKESKEKIEKFVEELTKVNESFNLTKEKLDKKTTEAKEMALKIDELSKTLKDTQEVLSQEIDKKEEKEYLLNIHREKEKKLSRQALTLLDVAHESTDDVNKLHSKLNRKRKIEEINEEQYQNFKKMSEKYYKQLNSLTFEINNKLEQNFKNIKNNSVELSSGLSEFKEKIIDLLLSIVLHQNNEFKDFSECLDQNTVDQKQWTVSLIESLQSKKDFLSSEHGHFLKTTLPLLIDELNKTYSDLNNWVLSKNNDICQMTSRLYSNIKTQSSKFINDVKASNSTITLVCEHYKSEKNRFEKQYSSLLTTYKELSEMQLCMQNKLAAMGGEINQIGDTFDRTDKDMLNLEALKISDEDLQSIDIETNFSLTTVEDITNTYKSDEIYSKFDSAASVHNTLSNEVIKNIEYFQMKEEEVINEMKSLVLEQSEVQQANIETLKIKLKDNQQSLSDKIKSEETSLETHNNNFQNNVSDTIKIIDTSKEQFKKDILQMREDLLQKDLEDKKFILEDLQKDIPTDTTPQRKNYSYPKTLSVYSPDDRHLQDLRLRKRMQENEKIAVNLPFDSISDDSGEFKSPSVEESTVSKITLSEPTAHVSPSNSEEDLSSCETESNASSTSNLSVDSSKNKENCQTFSKPSHLPRFTKTKLTSSFHRKPLTSKNPEPNV